MLAWDWALSSDDIDSSVEDEHPERMSAKASAVVNAICFLIP